MLCFHNREINVFPDFTVWINVASENCAELSRKEGGGVTSFER